MKQVKSNESYIELQEKLFNTGKELYEKDKGMGNLLSSVLTVAKENDVGAHKRLMALVSEQDKNLFLKNNLIQKIVLNRILLTHVLKLRSVIDDNLSSLVSLLSYNMDTNEWKKMVTKHLLPTLIKNNLF